MEIGPENVSNCSLFSPITEINLMLLTHGPFDYQASDDRLRVGNLISELQESRFPDETNPFSQYTHKQ
jgi:hypothetical protein